MGYITSGNPIVDDMAMLNISGNVVPQMWYSTITRDNGKPYLLAITLLSDIVYWHRPSEERDERTGNIIGLKKKFRGDLLQKTYQQYADMYGESKRSIKAAFDRLEELRVVKRYFRDVTCENGMILPNIMFIELNVEVLKILTYPQESVIDEKQVELIGKTRDLEDYVEDKNALQRVIQNSVGDGTKICKGYDKNLYEVVQNSVGDGAKLCEEYDKTLQEVIQNSARGNTKLCKPITKSTTENTTKNTYIDYNPIHLQNEVQKMEGEDMALYYQKLVKENIDYDTLRQEMGYRSDELDEIVKIMVDVLIGEGEHVRVNRAHFPYAEVKKRLLEIDCDHIRYVVDCLRKNHSSIANIRAYLLTSLFNAPATINNYYSATVNYDLVRE